MKILLAGPGTGKTTSVKSLIEKDFPEAKRIKVISFTNATVNDLTESFGANPIVSCSTLHSFALNLNHLPLLHIIDNPEEKKILTSLSEKLGINFNDLCNQVNCITFDEMILGCVSFIGANPAYSEEKIGKLDLLLVDEFQDFNPTEQKLVMLASQLAGETIILGDDDQAIYGFKDADPDGIIALFKDEKVEKLPHENICYRCPDEIVDRCTELLKANKKRISKEWKKSKKAGGIVFKQLLDQGKCDDFILQTVKEIREKDKEGSILILSPLNAVVESIKELMTQNDVEFIDCWAEDWDKDKLAKIWWMNAIYGKNKLAYVIFLHKYYSQLRKTKLLRLLDKAFHHGFTEPQLLKEISDLKYLPEPLRDYILSPLPIEEFFSKYSDFSFLEEFIDKGKIQESVASLTSKVKVQKSFEKGKINFMSIHKSKGLQAEYVIINGLVSGILPNEDRGLDTIEAQRRLLFVGMTRAACQLYMVSTVEWEGRTLKSNNADMKQFKFAFWKRKYQGKTSKFVEEMKK